MPKKLAKNSWRRSRRLNDAFGSAHRAHASTEGIVHHVRSQPQDFSWRPRSITSVRRCTIQSGRLRILGGAGLGQARVIENLLGKVDALLIGGAMAYRFARGVPVGKSLVEENLVATARDLEARAKSRTCA
jgi:phosphoglycerate kinase